MTLGRAALLLLTIVTVAAAISAQDDPIRVDTSIVRLNVGVADARGRPITDLTQGSFEVFEDGVLEPAEADALEEVAAAYDLSAADVASAHRAFTGALEREAVADGKVTRAERAELGNIADALGVPATAIAGIVKDAAADHHARLGAELRPLPEGWNLGEPLRVGDRVVFTGCDPDERASDHGGLLFSEPERELDPGAALRKRA